VLFRNNKQVLVSEDTWCGLVQSIALGDQLALHALYARVHGIVFAWIRPFVSDRKAAEELMLDVFHDVWRTASSYNANDHTVVGWIMSQARSRAIDRLRPEQVTPSLLPAIETVVPPQTDLGRQSTSLWLQLSRRIAAEAREEVLVPLPEGRTEPDWQEVAPGIFCKLLATDRTRHRVSMLVQLTPEVAYPPHTHAGVEELYLLHGELMIEDRKLYPGAYNRGEPSESDQFVWSRTGCICVLVTSTRDVLRQVTPGEGKRSIQS
jgi:DNA-directed RNA polymerase specialized sigma24 family protein